ncbi:hypothetical protein [Thalassotalea profundi]|uniref:Uncharacterized protein n=1 Tax=Thalassotalea profundi TaxID=2036687 RepID=A0ABQ3IET0_9GAMM|nr:hypothetical protein [Thalassotalea profundi]GHE81818.1 hypothetical protein GCM10011501_07700 [Thalassotalea profundi]
MNEHTYINKLSALFTQYFESVSTRVPDRELKNRIQGYIHAGEVLSIINREHSTQIMEEAHFQVFGENINERKNKKVAFKEALKTRDDSYFDIPAYERQKI